MQKSFLAKIQAMLGVMGGGFFNPQSTGYEKGKPFSGNPRNNGKKFVSKAKAKRIKKIAKLSRRKNRGAYRG